MNSTGSEYSNEMSFPIVDWSPEWPVRRLPWRKSVANYFGAVVFAVGAIVFTLLGVCNGIQGHSLVVVVGSLGGFLLLSGAAWLFIGSAGFSRELPRSGAFHNSNRTYGKGVAFLQKRFKPAIFVTISGAVVYGISAWLGWREGLGEDGLLPSSKDDKGGAVFALALGILGLISLVFLAVVTRWKMFVELYPSGVRRVIDLPFGYGWDTFIEWGEVESVAVGHYHPTSRSGYMPTIDLVLEAPRQSYHPRLDQPNRMAMPVYTLVAEPNTVLAIVRILHARPETRELLARPDAAAWFTPPPLSEQRRMSAQETKGEAAQ